MYVKELLNYICEYIDEDYVKIKYKNKIIDNKYINNNLYVEEIIIDDECIVIIACD